MDIKLLPHEGWASMPGGRAPRKVVLAQDRIEIDGELVGFVGHQDNAPICLIGYAAPSVYDRIRKVVDLYRGEDLPDRKVALPPKIGEIK